MLGAFIPYIPREKCNASPCKLFTFGRDREVCIFCAALHRCPFVWGVGTGEKNISHLWEACRRHILRGHTQSTVPERCAKRVKDLTHRIARTYTYPVAYGGFSDIWSCQLRRRSLPPKSVAVKAIRPVIANEEEFLFKRKAVKRELNVWFGLKHPNILPLYGVTDGFGPLPAFVCPWADNGTLTEYLETSGTRLDLKERMMLLSDVADGLRYLHSSNIIHGDLSGSNVLITKRGRACLSDFGLSTLFEQVSDSMVSGVFFPGNIRWAAPELLGKCEEGIPSSQLSSAQADIYSFGSVMLQILSGKLPFHSVQRVAQIVIMISRGSRPSRVLGWDGKDIPDVLWMFVEACWASPSKRPSSTKIVSFIKSQLSRLYR